MVFQVELSTRRNIPRFDGELNSWHFKTFRFTSVFFADGDGQVLGPRQFFVQ